jgi:hypothetical protein
VRTTWWPCPCCASPSEKFLHRADDDELRVFSSLEDRGERGSVPGGARARMMERSRRQPGRSPPGASRRSPSTG